MIKNSHILSIFGIGLILSTSPIALLDSSLLKSWNNTLANIGEVEQKTDNTTGNLFASDKEEKQEIVSGISTEASKTPESNVISTVADTLDSASLSQSEESDSKDDQKLEEAEEGVVDDQVSNLKNTEEKEVAEEEDEEEELKEETDSTTTPTLDVPKTTSDEQTSVNEVPEVKIEASEVKVTEVIVSPTTESSPKEVKIQEQPTTPAPATSTESTGTEVSSSSKNKESEKTQSKKAKSSSEGTGSTPKAKDSKSKSSGRARDYQSKKPSGTEGVMEVTPNNGSKYFLYSFSEVVKFSIPDTLSLKQYKSIKDDDISVKLFKSSAWNSDSKSDEYKDLTSEQKKELFELSKENDKDKIKLKQILISLSNRRQWSYHTNNQNFHSTRGTAEHYGKNDGTNKTGLDLKIKYFSEFDKLKEYVQSKLNTCSAQTSGQCLATKEELDKEIIDQDRVNFFVVDEDKKVKKKKD